jgi:outer membrane protein OmpA-like peptidoglycan-associated protein
MKTWAMMFVAAPLAGLAIGCGSPPPPAPPPIAEAPKPPPDADGDGIPDDGTDKCLLEKEDGLPPDPKDGCKSTDADGDGIIGDADKCPNEKEDGLPPDPKDGCASDDRDADGIVNASDKCPDQPETKNGFQDADGCPDVVPRVSVTKTEVKINEKIMFAFGKASIQPESENLLDEIAFVVNDNPQIEYFEVAGHADKVGTDVVNAQLTKARAQSVVDAMIKRKVDRRRMHAQGYGRYCPLDKADTEEGREKNRRVEFKIMRIDGVDTGVALGCEEAFSHGIKVAAVAKTAPSRAELEKVKKEHPPTPPPPPGSAPVAVAPPKPVVVAKAGKAPPKVLPKPPPAKAVPKK